MDKFQKSRRVRFNLPDPMPQIQSSDKVHGTYSYLNGTLINISSNGQPPIKIIQQSIPVKIQLNPIVIGQQHQSSTTCMKPAKFTTIGHSKSLPEINGYYNRVGITNNNYNNSNIKVNNKNYNNNIKSHYSTISSGPTLKPLQLHELRGRHIVVLNATPAPKFYRKVQTNSTICERFSRIKLFEEIFNKNHKNNNKKDQIEIESKVQQPPARMRSFSSPPSPKTPINQFTQRPALYKTNATIKKPTTLRNIKNNLFSDSNSSSSNLVADLIQRWHRMRSRALLKHLPNPGKSTSVADQQTTSKHEIIPINRSVDVKRFGCLKMALESEPTVTTLLRASRDADENLLKIVLRKMLIDGISKEALNSTDLSGRTAISYICSTNLTNFLDILLQIPGIDVNKPDNEGNTPLHFAAQAGQADSLNMLITRSRSLQVDSKNYLGFTPLMKAALQGRTRCAKLLLFAGASPTETDSGRRFRAEQWARFCGRNSCAEMLEKCARARLLEKTNSYRSTTTTSTTTSSSYESSKIILSRSKTNPLHSSTTSNTDSFRSRFRKFLPFGRHNHNHKDQNDTTNCNNSDIVNYLTTATLCATGPALTSQGKAHVMTTLLRPLEVPKLEVTPANNQQLIKKYESKLNRDRNDTTSPQRAQIRH